MTMNTVETFLDYAAVIYALWFCLSGMREMIANMQKDNSIAAAIWIRQSYDWKWIVKLARIRAVLAGRKTIRIPVRAPADIGWRRPRLYGLSGVSRQHRACDNWAHY